MCVSVCMHTCTCIKYVSDSPSRVAKTHIFGVYWSLCVLPNSSSLLKNSLIFLLHEILLKFLLQSPQGPRTGELSGELSLCELCCLPKTLTKDPM